MTSSSQAIVTDIKVLAPIMPTKPVTRTNNSQARVANSSVDGNVEDEDVVFNDMPKITPVKSQLDVAPTTTMACTSAKPIVKTPVRTAGAKKTHDDGQEQPCTDEAMNTQAERSAGENTNKNPFIPNLDMFSKRSHTQIRCTKYHNFNNKGLDTLMFVEMVIPNCEIPEEYSLSLCPYLDRDSLLYCSV